jgi:NMD protein affecting ribosome stability and mRNA decay
MNLISTSWSCARCGAAYISTPPEHGLCDQCLADLQDLARLAPIAAQPCPSCGGPVCADCGTALILLVPGEAAMAVHTREVTGDGG